ncbi:MAG: hypothetical protein SCH39_05820 [Methanosarcinales archaeon]|nr:hypothetical protein [Methanosarcinales archaeon]
MDYLEKERIIVNKEINTTRLLGMSISSMTTLLSLFLSLWHIGFKDVIILVSIFILGLTLVLSYISIGTRIENSAGEITSLIIVLTTLSNLTVLWSTNLMFYFFLSIIPIFIVVLYLFENKKLRKIFFMNIMTIIIVVKLVPLYFPQFIPGLASYMFP